MTIIPESIPAAENIMSTDVLTAYEGWTIQRLSEFFIRRQISAAPVIASDHELVGVVSVDDVFRFGALDDSAKGKALSDLYRDTCGQEPDGELLLSWVKDAAKNCTVHQIMTPEVIAVEKDADLRQISSLLLARNIHRVFVTENKKIVGVITAMDALRAYQELARV